MPQSLPNAGLIPAQATHASKDDMIDGKDDISIVENVIDHQHDLDGKEAEEDGHSLNENSQHHDDDSDYADSSSDSCDSDDSDSEDSTTHQQNPSSQ